MAEMARIFIELVVGCFAVSVIWRALRDGLSRFASSPPVSPLSGFHPSRGDIA